MNDMTEQKQIHILCMEDDPGLARLFKKCLERAGYRVDIAHDGKEGLSMVESKSYDIVAMDYKMPHYSGLDVIRILSAKDNPPPLIMITGTGSEEVAVEAMKMGAADYIIKDVDGHYLELFPSLIDKVLCRQNIIEEKNKAETALRESEEKYRLVVENASEAIFIAQEGVLKFINQATIQLLGYSEAEITSLPFTYFIHPEDREMVLERHMKRLKGETIPLVYSFRIVTKSGNILWAEIHAVVILWKDKQATLNFLSDITERKQAEEERERLILELQDALSKIRTLSGLLPICASCKKIRNDKGYWEQIEIYIKNHSDADFSHSICPECIKKLYPEYHKGS